MVSVSEFTPRTGLFFYLNRNANSSHPCHFEQPHLYTMMPYTNPNFLLLFLHGSCSKGKPLNYLKSLGPMVTSSAALTHAVELPLRILGRAAFNIFERNLLQTA